LSVFFISCGCAPRGGRIIFYEVSWGEVMSKFLHEQHMNGNMKLLERAYFAILMAIFLLIVFTPYIIRSGFTLVDEEIAEIVAIALFFAVGYGLFFLYRKESARNRNEIDKLKQDKGALERRLTDAFHYIGTVNIQIEEIRSVFSDIRKFPENKKDFRYILQFLAEKVLCMVNAPWVLFRIVDTQNLDTLSEYNESRGNASLPNHKISTKHLVSNEVFEGFAVVQSGQGNFHIKTFCIVPKEKLSRDQKVFIKALVNQLEMLFIIFSSTYYQNSHFKNSILSTPCQ
jgi:hypothetical protein